MAEGETLKSVCGCGSFRHSVDCDSCDLFLTKFCMTPLIILDLSARVLLYMEAYTDVWAHYVSESSQKLSNI